MNRILGTTLLIVLLASASITLYDQVKAHRNSA